MQSFSALGILQDTDVVFCLFIILVHCTTFWQTASIGVHCFFTLPLQDQFFQKNKKNQQ